MPRYATNWKFDVHIPYLRALHTLFTFPTATRFSCTPRNCQSRNAELQSVRHSLTNNRRCEIKCSPSMLSKGSRDGGSVLDARAHTNTRDTQRRVLSICEPPPGVCISPIVINSSRVLAELLIVISDSLPFSPSPTASRRTSGETGLRVSDRSLLSPSSSGSTARVCCAPPAAGCSY